MQTEKCQDEKIHDALTGLEINSWGLPETDPTTQQSSDPSVFCAGDVAGVAQTTVESANDGKVAALGMHKYLEGLADEKGHGPIPGILGWHPDRNVIRPHYYFESKENLGWAESLDGSDRRRALHSALHGWSEEDPAGAAQYVAELPTSEQNLHLVHEMAHRWAESDRTVS